MPLPIDLNAEPTREWEALIERADGSVHARRTFWTPLGWTEDHARGVAWQTWHEARAYGSTADRRVARDGLVVRPLAAALEQAA